ncbi:MAG: deoxyuridine 5'-triphosphate nucleotidohydrolase [Candidatus Cloacimonas sp. 4484_140]|nr:MAG: deoxyuridine 5'-triphosphate nucleotidohydrolase [Candidatus Cloacimonas sp. 4484_140]HHI88064.1 dUTP diphosphatase [Candidatus Cloacimonadota bacterium]
MISIKFRKLTKTAQTPQKMTEHSSGFDLYADVDELIIQPKDVVLISTGISLEIPPGYEAQVRPRSGLAIKHKIGILNSPGTIDADYRGEVKVILFNFGNKPFVVVRDMRIAQMVFARAEYAELTESTSLEETERNDGGFGHTG